MERHHDPLRGASPFASDDHSIEGRVLLEVALNGARSTAENPPIPRTPEELAREARSSVEEGAQVVHLHAHEQGTETLAAGPTADALRAVRASCPGIPISLSTSAHIEPDPSQRLALIKSWTQLPDLVTANQGEEGIIELCEYLIQRAVGIEAGLLSIEDAERFVRAGIAHQCARVLIEPLDSDPGDAVAHAAAIQEVLNNGGVSLEQVHHGDGLASWAVNIRAIRQAHGIRTGLEDTTVLPDGRATAGNAELVRAAARLIADES